MSVGGRPDDPDMTPHTLIERLIQAKAGNPDEYRDYLNTTAVALANRTDLEPLAQTLDQLISHYVSREDAYTALGWWADAHPSGGATRDTTAARTLGILVDGDAPTPAWIYTREHGWIDA